MPMQDKADHEAGLRAREAWERVRGSRLWSDWTVEIGPWLVKARTEAMARAGTNQPAGRGYVTAMSELLSEYGLSDMDGKTRWSLFKVMERLRDVEQWHARQSQPDRFNHPDTVWEAFERSASQQDRRDAGRKVSGAQLIADLRKQVEDRDAHIAELEVGREADRGYIAELETELQRVVGRDGIEPATADGTRKAAGRRQSRG